MRAAQAVTAATLVFALALAGLVYGQEIGDKALNDQIRSQLAAEGDDGKTPRPVDHWAFPGPSANAADYELVADLLLGLGFDVEPSAANDGIKFSMVTVLSDPGFDEVTKLLVQLMAKHGWRYDGWETVVVRNGEN